MRRFSLSCSPWLAAAGFHDPRTRPGPRRSDRLHGQLYRCCAGIASSGRRAASATRHCQPQGSPAWSASRFCSAPRRRTNSSSWESGRTSRATTRMRRQPTSRRSVKARAAPCCAIDERPYVGLEVGPKDGAAIPAGSFVSVSHVDVMPPRKDEGIAALKTLADPTRKDKARPLRRLSAEGPAEPFHGGRDLEEHRRRRPRALQPIPGSSAMC